MADAVQLAVLSLHLVLTALPMVATMLLAAACGLRRTPLLLCIGLAAAASSRSSPFGPSMPRSWSAGPSSTWSRSARSF